MPKKKNKEHLVIEELRHQEEANSCAKAVSQEMPGATTKC